MSTAHLDALPAIRPDLDSILPDGEKVVFAALVGEVLS